MVMVTEADSKDVMVKPTTDKVVIVSKGGPTPATAQPQTQWGDGCSVEGRGQRARKSLGSGPVDRSGCRRTARVSCCVPKCPSDDRVVKADGQPMRFFDLPDSSDRRQRRLWIIAIPELQFGVSPAHRKVCELHFIDNRPTDAHPCPALSLGGDVEPKAKKRKSEPFPVPEGQSSQASGCGEAKTEVEEAKVTKSEAVESEAAEMSVETDEAETGAVEGRDVKGGGDVRGGNEEGRNMWSGGDGGGVVMDEVGAVMDEGGEVGSHEVVISGDQGRRDPRRKAAVWNWFAYDPTTERSKCLIDGCPYSSNGKFTTTLGNHMARHPRELKVYLALKQQEKLEKKDNRLTISKKKTRLNESGGEDGNGVGRRRQLPQGAMRGPWRGAPLEQVLRDVAKAAVDHQSPNHPLYADTNGHTLSDSGLGLTVTEQNYEDSQMHTTAVRSPVSSHFSPHPTSSTSQTRIVNVPLNSMKVSTSGVGGQLRGIHVVTRPSVSVTSPMTSLSVKGIAVRPPDRQGSGAEQTGRAGRRHDQTSDQRNDMTGRDQSGGEVEEGETEKRTLQTVLEELKQSRQKEDEEQSSSRPVPPPPVLQNRRDEQLRMCGRCANGLPLMKRSMGRLESRLDSMISMVRTLCQRQKIIEQQQRPSALLIGRGKTLAVQVASSGSKTTPMVTVIRVPQPLTKRASAGGEDDRETGRGGTGSMERGGMEQKYGTGQMEADGAEDSDEDDTLHIDLSVKDGQNSHTSGQNPMKSPKVISYMTKPMCRTLLLYPGRTFKIADYLSDSPKIASSVIHSKLEFVLQKLVNEGLLHPLNEEMKQFASPDSSFEKEKDRTKLAGLEQYTISVGAYLNSFLADRRPK